MTRETFMRGMLMISAAWPERQMTDDTIEAYWLSLHTLHDSVYSRAVERALRECTFFPKPAEIWKFAEELLTEHDMLWPYAAQAWPDALQAIRSSSAAGLTNTLTVQVLRELGGVTMLGQTNANKLDQVMREFIARYQQHREHAIRSSEDTMMAAPIPEKNDAPKLKG